MSQLDRKTQQYLMLGAGAVGAGALLFVIFGVLGPKNTTATGFGRDDTIDIEIVADRTSAAAPEMSWVTTSRKDIETLNGMVEDLRKSFDAEREAAKVEIARVREEYDEVFAQQIEKIAMLEASLAAKPTAAPTALPTGPAIPAYAETGSEFIERRGGGPSRTTGRPSARGGDRADGERGAAAARSFGHEFTLASLPEEEEGGSGRNNLRSYIPAGSYAPAVVLSGADAATNVSDRENPIPVLFRITGPAVTAARGGGSGARINVKGCTVQGSAIGDLSSERVKVRLLSMTCLARNGEVIEKAISGYMVGAGKAGVRGVVVSREGGLVTNAAIAGALQGIASAASGATETGDDADVGEIARAAAASAGAGSVQTAASTLSEYYINRAEQYQPVISLNGGTQVELVFLEGVSLK